MNSSGQVNSDLLLLRYAADTLVAAEDLAGQVHNLYPTEEGSLRTVWGPAELRPRAYEGNGGAAIPLENYPTPHQGLFHAQVGKRSILLGQWGSPSHIYELEGWSKSWRALIGNTPAARIKSRLGTDGSRPEFLTQFVATPTGVVIVPQGDRAYFYDGETILPLGYSTRPSAPDLHGPRSLRRSTGTGESFDGGNDSGYYYSGRNLPRVMGDGRIGTTDVSAVPAYEATGHHTNPLGGTLKPGSWRGTYQHIDYFGNISPLSTPSAPVVCVREENLSKERNRDDNESVEAMKFHIKWTGIQPGRYGTIGRICGRTTDEKNDARLGFFELPSNAVPSNIAFATLPGNAVTSLRDNAPDEWLVRSMVDYHPVPEFKLAAMAMGRLWIANWRGGEAVLRPSLPGKYGTFPLNQDIIPDPSEPLTCLLPVQGGLLAMTQSSTTLITSTASGNMQAVTLSSKVGCVSPDSAKVMADGSAIWLGREGFYMWTSKASKDVEGGIAEVSSPISRLIHRINRSWRCRAVAVVDVDTGQYRCSIPIGGSRVNNMTVTFDGQGWTTRDDTVPAAACSRRGDLPDTLVLGTANMINSGTGLTSSKTGVYMVDHESRGEEEAVLHEAVLDTHWLRGMKSKHRGSPVRISLWFRETTNGSVQVETYRDWRDSVAMDTVTDADLQPLRAPTDDPPFFWDDHNLAATVLDHGFVDGRRPVAFQRRRLFWQKFDVVIPACEVFKIRLRMQGDVEFLGLSYVEVGSNKRGAASDGGRRR